MPNVSVFFSDMCSFVCTYCALTSGKQCIRIIAVTESSNGGSNVSSEIGEDRSPSIKWQPNSLWSTVRNKFFHVTQ